MAYPNICPGPEFESRIKLNEAGNSKFNFLNAHDPYNAYYRHKVKEIQEGVAQEKIAAQQPGYVVSVSMCFFIDVVWIPYLFYLGEGGGGNKVGFVIVQ